MNGITDPIQSMNILGECLTKLILCVEEEKLKLPHKVYQESSTSCTFGIKLHAAWHCSNAQLIALIVQLKSGVPASYDILRCNSDTSRYDLIKFFGRAKILQHRPYFVLEANKLTYNVQEV